MVNDALEIYDSCDLRKPNIPSRSRLYHLEPIGLNTSYVESLTSYIARLAEAHCLTSRSLVTKMISPELRQTFIKDCSSRNISALFKKSQFINSHGQITQELERSLRKLTLKQNLDKLTILRYSQILSQRKLLKKSKSWCPACYEQWHICKQAIYEPLLWTIADIEVCLYHYQPLQNNCPHCNQSIPWLTGNSRVGWCSHCKHWLGGFSQVYYDYDESKLAKHIWIAHTLGELISFISIESDSIKKTNISKALNLVINNTHQGNITAFAKTFGLPKNTVWMWCKGKSLPELKSLLTICYCLDISLLNFIFLKEKAFNSLQVKPQRLPTSSRIKRASPQAFDLKTVENYLQNVLKNSDTPPPAMKEVAKRLKIHKRTIERHCPTLCKAISAKYRHYIKASKNRGIENCCREIEQAVLCIYQSGEYPTEARVSQLISQPGYFRYKEVRDTLNDLVANLTFQP